jgi:hypothetical protein
MVCKVIFLDLVLDNRQITLFERLDALVYGLWWIPRKKHQFAKTCIDITLWGHFRGDGREQRAQDICRMPEVRERFTRGINGGIQHPTEQLSPQGGRREREAQTCDATYSFSSHQIRTRPYQESIYVAEPAARTFNVNSMICFDRAGPYLPFSVTPVDSSFFRL